MADTYQGWTNRETWAAHLHLTNSEANARWIDHLLSDYRADAPCRDPVRDGTLTIAECVRYDLADSLKATFEHAWDRLFEGGPDKPDRDMIMALSDIGSLWRVNWDEIAKALAEDAP